MSPVDTVIEPDIDATAEFDMPAEPDEGIQPDPPRSETERLDPPPTGPLRLESGTEVDIVPLRLRETMKLLQIVTHPTAGFLGTLFEGLDLEDGAAFAQTLLTVFVMAIPDAIEETVTFIQAMCRPVGLDDIADPKERLAAQQLLTAELHNPSLDDAASVIIRVIERESEDLRALGKRLASAISLARKVTKPGAAGQQAQPAGSAPTPKG